jgi:transposase InsO family protein
VAPDHKRTLVGYDHFEVFVDDGASYRSRAFAAALERLGARHRWTRPYRPQTNGKAERFIRTLLDE